MVKWFPHPGPINHPGTRRSYSLCSTALKPTAEIDKASVGWDFERLPKGRVLFMLYSWKEATGPPDLL